MPAPPKHRDAIINAAVALFRRRGYSGTGLNDIVALSGAPKGSLFHYFPQGKASIAEAAVRRAGENTAITMRTLSAEHKSAGKLVRAYAGLLAGWMAKSKFADGAPITTTVLEMAPEDEGITEAARAAFDALKEIFGERLREDGVPAARAASLAALAIAAIEGSLIQARVACSVEPIESAARELEALFAASIDSTRARKPRRRG